MLTRQEVFTKVKDHLLAQGCKSLDPNDLSCLYQGKGGTNCMYRGKDGTKCAVGCLIPDDKYCREMEGNHVCKLLDNFSDALSEVGKESYALLELLQIIHDLSAPEIWEQELRKVAKVYRLEY